jgi:hypothetical protein
MLHQLLVEAVAAERREVGVPCSRPSAPTKLGLISHEKHL